MHYRQRIRDAVKTLLINASTLAGANVFTSRSKPVLEILQKGQAVISVYTADETSTALKDGYMLERTLTVSIEGMAGGGDDLDNKLDDLAAQIEAAIDADPTLANLLSGDLGLTATTSEISARGNQQVGAFRLDYECSYLTVLEQEPTPIPLPDTVYVNPQPDGTAYQAMFNKTPDCATCDDDVCDSPAYGGDLTDENLVKPL